MDAENKKPNLEGTLDFSKPKGNQMMNQISKIFVEDEVTKELTVSVPFLGGLIRGIWSRYDVDNSGNLTRVEFKKFFEELFEGAGMGSADLVDWYLLE